jgi:serine/threonine-protein kinase
MRTGLPAQSRRNFKSNVTMKETNMEGIHDIPGCEDFKNIHAITKGLSGDEKYRVETGWGKRILLRVSDISQHIRKEAEYKMLERVHPLGVNTPEPLGFGLCGGGKSCYSLSSWIDGEDAETALGHMTETEQYVFGMKAGRLLQTIHTLPAPDDAEPWENRFLQKIQTRVDLYNQHGLQSEGGERIIKYLRENEALLKNRPQTFWHGDFSAGNIIITPAGDAGAIDFNFWGCAHGDPWWEFIAIPWGEEPAAHYITGLINGYFQHTPTEDFFRLLSYYFACDALSAVCYSHLGLEACEPEDGRRHMENILRWFDNMSNNVPTWYLKDFYIQSAVGRLLEATKNVKGVKSSLPNKLR